MAGLSAEQLAERVGTSQKQIYRLENGERRLTDGWMGRIAKALHCSTTDLLSPGASAGVDSDVEPYTPKGEAGRVADTLQSLGFQLYKVTGESLSEVGFSVGDMVTVSPEDREFKNLDVVLVEMGLIDSRKVLVLRQYIEPGLLITNQPGANLAVRLDDPVVKPRIIGQVHRSRN